MSQLECCATLWDWLSLLRLEQYHEVFKTSGLTTLKECSSLTQKQLEFMGITLPGHQRRILSSLTKTQYYRDEHQVQTDPCNPQMERVESDGKDLTPKPLPREKSKPVPRERRKLGMKEEMDKIAETMGHEEKEAVNRVPDEKPVPKERTRFPANALSDSSTISAVSRSCDSLPPVPPRSTANCPPQPFTSAHGPAQTPVSPRHVGSGPAVDSRSVPHTTSQPQAPQQCILPPTEPRPQTLSIHPPEHLFIVEGGKKKSPTTPSVFLCQRDERNAPPLPPKTGPTSPPPIPQRVSRTHSPTITKTPATMSKDQVPQVSPVKPAQNQENHTETKPELPECFVSQSLPDRPGSADDSDYEDARVAPTDAHQGNTHGGGMSLPVPENKHGRFNSWSSDDGLLGEGEDDRTSWKGSIYLPATTSLTDRENSTAVIKTGWLDKNPPQGALYYQRRWVKLDVDYLRYYDGEKEVYSKGIICVPSITNVSSVGELKFDVVTSNRTFTFRADNEADRNDWVTLLSDCTRGQHTRSTMNPGSPMSAERQGYLELKGLRSKLYTVVAADKVFLYKNIEDYRIGVGITSIEMNVGNVKETDRRSFDLTTPYRIFSFVAESEQLKELWVEAMRAAIGEALSNSEVVKRIWEEPSNSFCADCGSPKPEWAAINLCVVVCKRCAGEHRGLGPSISKIRSLKMDRKVWTEELVKLFLVLGNERVNSFWAANVPPSEALAPSSCTDDRRHFITNKYRQGKYRKYHPLYGNQRELNNALCISVQCSDVLETLSLIFCGADVNCSTGMANCPSPLSLANTHAQPLQAELLSHNLNTEFPRSEAAETMNPVHYSPPPCVSHNGFLFKTGSMTRLITEQKAKEEFSRRWCTLNDGVFSYFESDRNSNPNGSLKASEIVCLAVDSPAKHKYEHTFELYSESDRLYLFGTDDPESHKEWVKSIAKSFIPARAEPLLKLSFERLGRLKCKDGLNLQTSKVGWFALVGSTLHAYLDGSQGEEIHLRKLSELSIQQDSGVLVLVEKGRTLYIEAERKLDFSGWCGAIQTAARSGDTLSQQQLTETDIPIIVNSCIAYITQCGLNSEGIYRKSGVTSRVAALCERFRQDARSLCLKEEEHHVDDVSNTLKRFLRELTEGLFTAKDSSAWLNAAAIQDESKKIPQYKFLLNRLPRVNKATLQALINHLYCVQRFSELNQMNLHNLAIVFGPTLFQTDGKDYTAGRAIEDLIQHYTLIFEVDEHQLNRQMEEIEAIIKMRATLSTKFPSTEPGGHFICTVYLEEGQEARKEQHVQIPGSMTAAELTYEFLDQRNIPVKEKDFWSCWEICDKEEMERPLHFRERVLPILHSFGTDSYLLIKKHQAMEAMILYLAGNSEPTKHGMMKFREERSILGLGLSSGNFNDKYFILNSSSLRMYKEIRSNRPERDWPVKNLTVYMGVKKKLRSPTSWGLTVVYEGVKQEKPEKHQWYLCCKTQTEMMEWYATFFSIQNGGDIWPEDGVQRTRVSRVHPDTRHGNISLIPLRGSENEMRNSVAAFCQDPLALFRDVR
ncbi:arf-GAP with Rho-GAP domain, ANK repeat and PH domain-containing protein 1 isoform 1-T1 [Synchiropus picturatus]